MPIQNLTSGTTQAFMKLGKIRKGDRGGKNGAPRDLDHFRVTFMAGKSSEALEKSFRENYGATPTEINIRLPYNDIWKNWDANYECYKQGGLVAQAGTNEHGAYWIFYRDMTTSEVLVRNGAAVGLEGRKFLDNNPCDVDKPVYYNSSNEPVMLEPVGRLQVVIPELAHLEVGFFEFTPTSPRDIRTISAELAAFDAIAKSVGKGLAGIPFKLIRRKEEVTKKIKNQLTKGDSWVVHITTGGDWGVKALEAVERMALPDVIDVEPEDVGEYEEEVDTAFPRLPSYTNEPIVVGASEPTTPADAPSLIAARQVIVTVKGGQTKFMGELKRDQLEYVIRNGKNPAHVEAASLILSHDFEAKGS